MWGVISHPKGDPENTGGIFSNREMVPGQIKGVDAGMQGNYYRGGVTDITWLGRVCVAVPVLKIIMQLLQQMHRTGYHEEKVGRISVQIAKS